MANVDLPTPLNCPIKTSDGTEMCMCMCHKCELVDANVCFAIRVAYRFGYENASDKYTKIIKKARNDICNLMEPMIDDWTD